MIRWRWLFVALLAARVAVPGAVGATGAEAERAPLSELIVVAPNTGGSSGGHAGLRLGGSVYHFMAGSFDSLLLLYRVTWEEFHERYCDLENRQLNITRLAFSEGTASKVEAQLKHTLAVQDKHLYRLDALQVEQQWLSALSDGGAMPELPGRGFFEGQGDRHGKRLRGLISAQLGERFLSSELQQLDLQLQRDSALGSVLGADPVDSKQFPQPVEIPAEVLFDRLLFREALLNLEHARGLAAEQVCHPVAGRLSRGERELLGNFAAQLERDVVRLLQSPRPDRGRPLMVATARYLATQRSLEQGQLCFLDSFPETSIFLDPDETKKHRVLLEALAERTSRTWESIRADVFAKPAIAELDYHRLEVAASRYQELLDATRRGKPIRVTASMDEVPARGGAATPPKFDVDIGAVRTAAAASRGTSLTYGDAVREAYGFNLLKHNCSTELTKLIRSAFSSPEEAAAALGGNIEPGAGLSVVPIGLSGEARRSWSVAGTQLVPSRRKREVARLISEGRPLLVKARESNRLTSKAYPGSIDDDAFMFFSDGPVVFRPLQGLANISYGVGHTCVGVVTAPFDKGRRVGEGARGVFWSLPELVGLSIRRGHYDLPAEEED